MSVNPLPLLVGLPHWISPAILVLTLLMPAPSLPATEAAPATEQAAMDTAQPEEAQNLQAIAVTLRERNLPLLLAFVADYCSYCERLKREHLIPMTRSGDFQDQILIRTIHLDRGQQLTDFNGERIGIRDFSRRYGVRLTPALLFLDADGKEVAERLLGYSVPDFYGAYLEQSITAASRAVKPSTTLLPEALRQCGDG